MKEELDQGVRKVVLLLNGIPGVRTTFSCEGSRDPGAADKHSCLAYVLARDPFPRELIGFLLRELAGVARVEEQCVYSLWPERNQIFCARLLSALRHYRREVPS